MSLSPLPDAVSTETLARDDEQGRHIIHARENNILFASKNEGDSLPIGAKEPLNCDRVRYDFRVGLGHDTHRLVAERALILGGVRIEHTAGLDGHSDADVLLHAITDALLGAAGLGDIGELFPDTDPQYQGADSSRFLIEALKRVRERGWQLVNLDCTIHAQRPKLSAYKPAIQQRLAELLEMPVDAVNVKAKTGERVGPVGREEAMSADAVVLIQQIPKEI